MAVVKPGRVLFEIAGVPEAEARQAFKLAASKLPIRDPSFSREVYVEMKAKDLRERSTEDLAALKASMMKDLFSYRMKNWTDQLEDTSLIQKTKRRRRAHRDHPARASARSEPGSQVVSSAEEHAPVTAAA